MPYTEDVREFKQDLTRLSTEEILDKYILCPGAKCIQERDIIEIHNAICGIFNEEIENVQIFIVGSCKLGFSIVEKRSEGKLRYRQYTAASDIDVAIIGGNIFDKMWGSAANEFYRQHVFPPITNKFGDYLACEWLRPDKMPSCYYKRTWDEGISNFNRRYFRCRRGIRGALFNSINSLRQYYSRAIFECKLEEEQQ